MQIRRLASVLLAAAAVAVVADRAVPGHAEPMVDVVVAAEDLRVGHQIAESDLSRRTWPAAVVPDSWPRSTEHLVGQRLNGPVGRGEPVVPGRVGSSTVARGAPAGTRLVHVPLAEPGVLRHLAVGDHVDLLAAGSGAALAARARVVALTGSAEDIDGGLVADGNPPAPGLLVMVNQQTAARLAVAIGASQPGEGVVVSLLPGDAPR